MRAIYTIWLRNFKRFIRSKSRMIASLAQPLFFLVTLGFGLNSVLNVPGMGSYMDFIIPGIIGMTALFSGIFSGIQVIWDRQFGFLKETLIAPVSRVSIMLGQTLGGTTTAFIQGTLIMIISLFMIATVPSIWGVLLALAFLIITGMAFTALGIAIASRMSDMQGFQLIINFVIFPIFFTSGALFPLASAPKIMTTISYFNPLTYGIEGMRYGLFGISQINPALCLIVITSFATAMVLFGGWMFTKIKV